MLGFLGVFLLILGTNASSNLPDFTVNKLEGKWYLSSTASGAGWIENPKRIERVSVIHLTPTPGGDMRVRGSLMITPGGTYLDCITTFNLLKKTKTVGKFILNSLDYQPLTEISFLDVKYDEYIIIQNKRITNQSVTSNLELYTRKTVVSLEVKMIFCQIALKQQFVLEKIIFIPYQGECD